MRTLLLSLALTAAAFAVTPPSEIKVPAGFKVELLREAGPDEGSWICMAIDDQGRLYISTQDAGPQPAPGTKPKSNTLFRATLNDEPAKNTQDAKPGEILNPKSQILNWSPLPIPISDAMGMLWAFDSLYVSGHGPQGRGIYRCKSSHGDGNLDTVTLFKAIPGGAGEHGAHAIILGPDKRLYIVHGNTAPMLDGLSPDSPYRNWGEDDLLPRVNDPVAAFFDKVKAPYGCIYRTDENGTKWELFAGGFRNPYDIAFNPGGELFTYDSDMEWDRGLPWYRPTRILHVVPGGEYGFREGSAKWPAYFPDSLPPVADIGLGCPTGMKFGTDAKGWPEKYRRALFMHDWTYGRILAVTLHEKGASYTARNDLKSYTYPKDAEANHDVEVFLSGKGVPITDMEFGKDGAMYFTTGGRGAAAALYRVTSLRETVRQEPSLEISEAKETREIIHILAGSKKPDLSIIKSPEQAGKIVATAMVNTDHFAWFSIYLIGMKRDAELIGSLAPKNPQNNKLIEALQNGLVSSLDEFRAIFDPARLDRAVLQGSLQTMLLFAHEMRPSWQVVILESFKKLPLSSLPADLQLLKLRSLELSFARQGRPSEEWVKAVMEELLAHYPVPANPANAKAPARNPAAGAPVDDPAWRLNRELCALLVWLSNPELGELNSELPAKADGGNKPAEPGKPPAPAPVKGKTGDSRSDTGRLATQRRVWSEETVRFSPEGIPLRKETVPVDDRIVPSRKETILLDEGTVPLRKETILFDERTVPLRKETIPLDERTVPLGKETIPLDDGTVPLRKETIPLDERTAPSRKETISLDERTVLLRKEIFPSSEETVLPAGVVFPAGQPAGYLLAQAESVTGRPLPADAPAAPAARPLGPVPNPGAKLFPGRKPAPFHAELGRQVIEKTLALMDAAPSQEEQIWYALCLRWAYGWTPEQRTRYFRWFHEKAAGYTGGNSFTGFLNRIRTEALARCTPEERAALGHLASSPTVKALVELKPRAFVQAWTMADLEPSLGAVAKGRDFARGRELFGQAQCILCHKMGVTGGNVGPDLTAVAARFPRKDILTAILDPNKDVSDQYAMVTFTVRRGEKLQEVMGLVQEDTGGTITVLTDPLAGTTQAFYHHVVVKKEMAKVSIMPPGLLNTLTKDEVLDLLAYLEAGGKAEAGNFR